MELDYAGQFVYFLMVVLLWGSPIAAIALFLAYRKNKFKPVAIGVLVAWPVMALIGLATFQLDLQRGERENHVRAEFNRTWFGEPDTARIYDGVLVDNSQYHTLVFNRYLFEIPGGKVQVEVPTKAVMTASFLKNGSELNVAGEPAQLILLNAQSFYASPKNAGDIKEAYPDLKVTVPWERVVIASVYDSQSSVRFWVPEKNEWVYNLLQIHYDTL